MDTAALRHLESLVDGLNRQINGLRFRIEAIRTRARAESPRRVTEMAHVFESYVPIEIFMASARSEVTARDILQRRITELRADNEQLREQLYLLQLQLEPLLGLPLALQQLHDEVGDLARTVFPEPVVNAATPSSTLVPTLPGTRDPEHEKKAPLRRYREVYGKYTVIPDPTDTGSSNEQ